MINPFSANPTKWSNTVKQFLGRIYLTFNFSRFYDKIMTFLVRWVRLWAERLLVHLEYFRDSKSKWPASAYNLESYNNFVYIEKIVSIDISCEKSINGLLIEFCIFNPAISKSRLYIILQFRSKNNSRGFRGLLKKSSVITVL